MEAGKRQDIERSKHGGRNEPNDRLLFEAIGDGLVLVDADGLVTDMNGSAETLFGADRVRYIGRKLSALMPALNLPGERLLERSRTHGGVDAEAHPNALTIPLHILVSRASRGGKPGYVLAVRDFRPIRSAQRRAIEAERLGAVDEIMHALAHESRNALQRMQSCLTLIDLRGGEQVHDLVGDIQEAQDELNRLYDAVGDFAAPLHLQPRDTDVRKLLDETWHGLSGRWASKQLVWSTSYRQDLDTHVPADAARVAQAFENVLINAIDASPEHGCVIAVLAADGDGEAPAVRVTIEDEGDGIENGALERVFDVLFSTKPGGAGLPMARRILREHGGDVHIEPGDGRGARVVMRLPRNGTTR